MDEDLEAAAGLVHPGDNPRVVGRVVQQVPVYFIEPPSCFSRHFAFTTWSKG